MTSSLFRPEVVQAQQAQWLGSIRIARRPGFTTVTTIAIALAVALVAFAVFGIVQRKATVPGILVPVGGLIQVVAPQAGVVSEWLVREGDRVAAGQSVARIRNERHTARGEAGALVNAALEQRRQSLQTELQLLGQQARQRIQALDERQRSLALEAQHLSADLTHAVERVRYARQNERRFEELASTGFVSTVQAQQKREEVLELLTRENTARRGLQAIERELRSAQAEKASLDTATRTGEEQLRRALVAVAQEEAELQARQAIEVLAPKSGRVGAMTLEPGQSVQAGQTLLSLITAEDGPLPGIGGPSSHGRGGDAALQALLFAPSRRAGFVRPGQTVWLRYDAFPYAKFGMAQGTVLHVGNSPIAAQDLPLRHSGLLPGSAQAHEPLLRVTVQLHEQSIVAHGERWPLKPATTLEADIVQERRAIWEWLLEPLLAAKERNKTARSSPNDAGPGG